MNMSKVYFKKLSVGLLVIALVISMMPFNVFATTQNNPDGWQWYKYGNSVENMSITNKKTPTDKDSASEKWAVKYGSGWSAAPTPPIIKGDHLYFAVGSRMLEVDKNTGLETEKSKAYREPFYNGLNVGYGLNPPLYAEGMIFIPIEGGRIQAIDANTLEPKWSTKGLGGQSISNLAYTRVDGKGYIYTGTWDGNKQGGSFFAVAIDNEGLTSEVNTVNLVGPNNTKGESRQVTQYVKDVAWKFTPETSDPAFAEKKGFYWGGAYATDKYVIIGSDAGDNGSTLYSLNPKDGTVIDTVNNLEGNIRSGIAFKDNYAYFATQGKKLYKVNVLTDGSFEELSSVTIPGAATATPVVYKDRIYLGFVGKNQFSADGGHGFMVINDEESLNDGSIAYVVGTPGYPQATPLISTAYENEDFDKDGSADGRVYVYFTANAQPGGILYFYDTPTATDSELKNEEIRLFTPEGAKKQYCISPLATDSEGTIYYKNDSGHIFAIERTGAYLDGIEITPNSGTLTMDLGSQLPENFKPNKLTYSGKFDGAQSVEVKPISKSNLPVKVNGEVVTDETVTVELNQDVTNTINIDVANKGEVRRYVVTLNPKGLSAKLMDIEVTDDGNTPPWLSGPDNAPKQLLPAFDKETKEYTTLVDDKIRNPFAINLWITPEDPNASIRVYPLENHKTGYSMDSDGQTLKTYKPSGYKNGNKSYRVPVDYQTPMRDMKYRIRVTSENGKNTEDYIVTIGLQYHVASVDIDQKNVTLEKGDKVTLHEVITPDNADDKSVVWSTRDSEIIKLDQDGTVTGLKKGVATVTVTTNDGSKSETAKITVNTTLEDAQDKAIEKIKAAYNVDDYTEAGQKELDKIVKKAEADIKKTTSVNQIKPIEDKALEDIDNVKTRDEEAKSELDAYKAKAKETLAAYYDPNNYRPAEQTQLTNIINEGNTAIDGADNKANVDSKLAEAKAKVDTVKTKAQYEAEEAATELQNFKNTLKEQLVAYKDSNNYKDAEKAEITKIVDEGKAQIDEAVTRELATAALDTYKAKLDKVKTKAQYDAEAFESAKEAAKKDLANSYNPADYRDAENQQITAILEAANGEIDKAIDKDGITAAVKKAEEKIAAVKTKAQYEAEEAAALAEYKKDLQKQLEDYKNADDYRPAEKDKLAELLRSGIAAIEAATTKDLADKSLSDSKAEMDKLITAKEYDKQDKLAEKVVEKINNLDDITVHSGNEIADIEKDYDKLTEYGKSKVTNLNDFYNKRAEFGRITTMPVFEVVAEKAANKDNALETSNGIAYVKEQSKGLVITMKNGDFRKFMGVEINGLEVDSSNYTAKSGSIIVSFKKAYLDGLKPGEYTAKIKSEKGYGEVKFQIKEKASAPTNPAGNSSKAPTVNVKKISNSPNTGDASNVMAYSAVLALALAVGVIAYRRKLAK